MASPGLSPYNYCKNNPVVNLDTDGLKDKPYNKKTDKPIDPKAFETLQGIVRDGTLYRDQKAYNCITYAFGDVDKNRTIPGWDNNPGDNLSGYTQLKDDEPNKVGDRVIYYVDKDGCGEYDPDARGQEQEAVHAAIVTKVDKQGNTTLVTGKMGAIGISENHPNAPEYYNLYKELNKEPKETKRVYYRLKDLAARKADAAQIGDRKRKIEELVKKAVDVEDVKAK